MRRAQSVPGPAAPGRRWLALAVLCVTLLMVTLDTTVLNVALPTLAGAARSAFVSGMDLGLLTGALVAFAGCAVALAVLPNGRRPASRSVPSANETGDETRRGIRR